MIDETESRFPSTQPVVITITGNEIDKAYWMGYIKSKIRSMVSVHCTTEVISASSFIVRRTIVE